MCLFLSLDIILIMMEGALWPDMILCIKIIARPHHLIMDYGNVSGIVHNKRAEGIVCHEINIFHPSKSPHVVNCITIIFHLPDTLSIEH